LAAKFPAPKFICAIKKPHEKNGALRRTLSREECPAQIGSRRFPDFRPPDFSPQDARRFSGKIRRCSAFFERPFPAGLRKAKRASGDCVSAAPADYSGGTVADFHGLLFTLKIAH